MKVICHGIPDQRELQDGDIVNVDVTAFIGGYHGDLNETFCVGEVRVPFVWCKRGQGGGEGPVLGLLVRQPVGNSTHVVCGKWLGGGGLFGLCTVGRQLVHAGVAQQDSPPTLAGLTTHPPWQLDCCCGAMCEVTRSSSYRPLACASQQPVGKHHQCLLVPAIASQVDASSKALIRASHDSLMAAVAACRPGVRFRDLGDTISRHVSNAG